MTTNQRPIAFVLVSSNHGTLIVNRHDYHQEPDGGYFGVGLQILTNSSFDPQDVQLLVGLLARKRTLAGDGVVALDCGANIGVHTVEWARAMHGWGQVLAFEAQERVYYALAGNLALNNCFNASARLAAVGAAPGRLTIPQLDPATPASFGSLELKPSPTAQPIGQPVRYTGAGTTTVDVVSIDALDLPRVDLIKIDVEGMELEVLAGSRETLARCRPVLFIEVLKNDPGQLKQVLGEAGYVHYPVGINLLAVHPTDPLLARIRWENGMVRLA